MKFLFLNTFLIFCSLIVIYYRLEIATKLKILDYPDNKRKIHTNPIPLLGGCIICGVVYNMGGSPQLLSFICTSRKRKIKIEAYCG